MPARYAIVDLETTGGRASRDRITEIGIVLHDGHQVIQSWETLVNPECYIPYGITQLTGITQEMVQEAPKFYEVARKVVELTEGAIFVAHNVRFDYGFLREEFRRLGYTFTRRQLCTVRLSRKVFPGLPSYSLGRLIRHFDIPVDARHRALADASATARLLELILAEQESALQLKQMINLGIKESRLPKHISLATLHELPEACGVYYLHDERGDVVYVGKSINIRKRIFEHFADPSPKGGLLQRSVHHISCECTGSELLALLLESVEIKRLSPPVNRAQKMRSFPYVITTSRDPAGYLTFKAERLKVRERKGRAILCEHSRLAGAQRRLKYVLKEYGLCSRLCGLEPGSRGPCFQYHLKNCEGACAGQESPESYNRRAEAATEYLRTIFAEDFFILEPGRQLEELAVIRVENSRMSGYGYLEKRDWDGRPESLDDAVQPIRRSPETTRLIQRFLEKHPKTKCLPKPKVFD